MNIERDTNIEMNIGIVLPTHAKRTSGGYKVLFEYSNYLAERNHKVTIYYMLDRFLLYHPVLKNTPKIVKKVAGKIRVLGTPRWFQLNRAIRKHALFSQKDIGQHDILIATALRTAFFVNDVRGKCKKAYFIQDFENWNGVGKDTVIASYGLGLKNITVAQWLSDIVDKYAKTASFCVSNGIDTRVFYLRNPIQRRPRHSLCFHYRKEEFKGSQYVGKEI